MDQELKKVFDGSIDQSKAESFKGSGANGMRAAAIAALVFAICVAVIGICMLVIAFYEEEEALFFSGLVCLLSSSIYFFCVALFRAIATMTEAAFLYKKEKLNK